jgi:hypothetical protein
MLLSRDNLENSPSVWNPCREILSKEGTTRSKQRQRGLHFPLYNRVFDASNKKEQLENGMQAANAQAMKTE